MLLGCWRRRLRRPLRIIRISRRVIMDTMIINIIMKDLHPVGRRSKIRLLQLPLSTLPATITPTLTTDPPPLTVLFPLLLPVLLLLTLLAVLVTMGDTAPLSRFPTPKSKKRKYNNISNSISNSNIISMGGSLPAVPPFSSVTVVLHVRLFSQPDLRPLKRPCPHQDRDQGLFLRRRRPCRPCHRRCLRVLHRLWAHLWVHRRERQVRCLPRRDRDRGNRE